MWIGLTESRGAAELTKRLDVKRSDVRARGDMIGIPLPNILDRWALHTGRCGGATAEKGRAVPERPPVDPYCLLRLATQNDVCHWSTAAGFWLPRGKGHDRTPVAPHYAFFPSCKAAGFHHASLR